MYVLFLVTLFLHSILYSFSEVQLIYTFDLVNIGIFYIIAGCCFLLTCLERVLDLDKDNISFLNIFTNFIFLIISIFAISIGTVLFLEFNLFLEWIFAIFGGLAFLTNVICLLLKYEVIKKWIIA